MTPILNVSDLQASFGWFDKARLGKGVGLGGPRDLRGGLLRLL